ncbi:hypothetical protein SUGI_1206550 [Cryptomeria japonica]|nr:hypothetical protein SUGI_1206550 [Cryptomeria japonica]
MPATRKSCSRALKKRLWIPLAFIVLFLFILLGLFTPPYARFGCIIVIFIIFLALMGKIVLGRIEEQQTASPATSASHICSPLENVVINYKYRKDGSGSEGDAESCAICLCEYE